MVYAGVHALKARRGTIEVARRIRGYWIPGAMLLTVGTLALLTAMSHFVGPDGVPLGTWATFTAAVTLIVLGRLTMLRFRARVT